MRLLYMKKLFTFLSRLLAVRGVARMMWGPRNERRITR